MADVYYVYRGKLERNWVAQVWLEVKKLEAKYDWLFLRINCNEKCMWDFLRGWNASSKVRLIVLEVKESNKGMVDVFGG